ncbi:hypothetical protein [Campylobacter upsaliensis]|uniref:hypothetical protein n=1 Tax=Campylobacter upsaliensis TaxID=28080 RepID=UPI0022EB7D6A|nr:hypothetical protein [Campylobacter upsaliensis]MEB2790780.1 hypothetical protein [Campylobacter upsaliensis]
MNFLQAKDKIYSKKDFYEALKSVGIGRGDCICVHTELFNLGIVWWGVRNFWAFYWKFLKNF